MLSVTLRGQPATYTTEDGWRSNCGLTERYLREFLTHEPTETAARVAVQAEYGAGCIVAAEPVDATPEATPEPRPEKAKRA